MYSRSRQTADIMVVFENDLEDTGRLLGRGGMGCVYLYRCKYLGGQNVAVKKLDGTRYGDFPSLKEEAKILWGLHEKCRYILQLYGMMNTSQGVGLVMEYMEHGNVRDFFKTIANKALVCDTQQLKHRIAIQVCDGMNYLHGLSKPVIHCDLKARNVLLDSDLNVKICDFGLAKIQRLTSRPNSDEATGFGKRHRGTLSHVAPELLRNPGKPTKKSDVYSFGIFLWELVTEEEPYEDVSFDALLMKFVSEGKRPKTRAIAKYCNNLVSIMEECWGEDAQRRPSFSEIRRRIPCSASSDIEASTQHCKDAWVLSHATNENSATIPKTFRSTGNEDRRRPTSSYLNEDEPQQRLQQRLQQTHSFHWPGQGATSGAAESPSDVRESEVRISTDSGLVSATSTSKAMEYERFPDGASNQPLLANPPTLTPHNFSRKCGGSKIALCIGAFISGCGAAFIIFWLTLYTLNEGCCINCFDLSTPLLKGNCSTSQNARAPVGSICNFSCPIGYKLNGNTNQIHCTQNGIWSGPLPYCRKIRQCRPLNPPANSGGVQCTNGWYEGSQCSFQCKDGYRLRLPGDHTASEDDMSITCNADDIDNFQWSGPEPYCEKVVQCGPLPHDDNVEVSCQPNGQGFSNGTVCQLSCKDQQMSLENEQSVALCTEVGQWNVTDEIKCIDGCSSLPSPANGNYTCNNGRKYSSTCTYNCASNFFLVGPKDIACQNSGTKKGAWSAQPPTCVCPSCRSGTKCENNVSFKETWDTLNVTLKTVFDGRSISCKKTGGMASNGEQTFGCQCKDDKSNMIKQCNDDDPATACEKAYGSLLLIMSTKQICSLPCDAEYMPGLKC